MSKKRKPAKRRRNSSTGALVPTGRHPGDNLVNTTGFRPGGYWHNPGRDEAIAGLVLAFLFPILGFILAVLSVNRSRRFGWPAETMAKAALWVSVLTIVLGIISIWWLRAHIGVGGYLPVIRSLWWV